MTRLNKIHLTYLIVKEYNRIEKKPVTHELLVNYIRQKTAASRKTIIKYISDLENGIEIEGKKYKIEYYNGGYQCQKKTKHLI